MRAGSRKFTAGLIITFGGAVIVATVAASWDPIVEHICVWRLDSTNPERREAAAQRLIELGSVKVVPYLIEKLSETLEDHGVDGAAFEGTPVMDLVNRRGADPQKSRLGGVSPEFYRLLSVLHELAQKRPAAEECFLVGLRAKSPPARALCAFLLAETGTKSDAVRTALRALLNDSDDFVRLVAIVVLGGMGPESAPPLVEALSDHGNRRRAAVWALAAIGTPAVPHLLRALEHGKNAVPIYAAYLLGRIGPPARAAVPALTAILEDDTAGDTFRRRVAVALNRIGATDVLARFGLEKRTEGRNTVRRSEDDGETPKRARSSRRFR